MSKDPMPRLCIVHRENMQCMAMDVPGLGHPSKQQPIRNQHEASRVCGLEPKAIGSLDEEVEDEPPRCTEANTVSGKCLVKS